MGRWPKPAKCFPPASRRRYASYRLHQFFLRQPSLDQILEVNGKFLIQGYVSADWIVDIAAGIE
jgi:hypothetical protein